eukprot:TRINITY_DN4399_c0_g1_i1.p2 TRINITY_DN4399_c0_g1~~TRINITY_DN4399_c0_g1_i1.p2  ORF type:complete len:58 (-),score=1.95 TRINITY_DN4399_c0_g1_i1:169-342(-)
MHRHGKAHGYRIRSDLLGTKCTPKRSQFDSGIMANFVCPTHQNVSKLPPKKVSFLRK